MNWTFVSGSFATNAIGTLTYDAAHNTLYAGTGEPNASGDSEAGFGIYKSLMAAIPGRTLPRIRVFPPGQVLIALARLGMAVIGSHLRIAARLSMAVRSPLIVVDPANASILYVSSVAACAASAPSAEALSRLAPGLPPFGVWKSTDGGANFTLLNYQDVCLNPDLPGDAGIIQASFGSTRGVHETALDPGSASIVYAGPYPSNNVCPNNVNGGVWRSTDSGATWTQMKNALNPALNTDRASFAVTPIAGGFTRMYVGVGNSSQTAANRARLFRTDDAVTATDASFTNLTAIQDASAAPNQTLNYCGDPAIGGANAGTTMSFIHLRENRRGVSGWRL